MYRSLETFYEQPLSYQSAESRISEAFGHTGFTRVDITQYAS
jgi:hypothetical protein